MRVRAADDAGIRLPGLVQVVGIAAFAAQEGGVFGAADGFSDHSRMINADPWIACSGFAGGV
jgi:hypothetical protein